MIAAGTDSAFVPVQTPEDVDLVHGLVREGFVAPDARH